MNRHLSGSDVRGLVRFALDGARMITDVVEGVHAAVLASVGASFVGPVTPFATSIVGSTGAISGLVYRSIHVGYDAVEGALSTALGLFIPASDTPLASSPERERMLAILNGVWGDHLAASANPLAIEMTFRHEGVPLVLEEGAIRRTIPGSGRKLLVLVHGLCMNDLGWRQGGHDHGAELARDLGFTPLYLHYNTGLHVSTNGKRFAELLETLVKEWPEPVDELAIVGHSMGGLVARSAAHYGTLDNRRWLSYLRRLVFLGTPHHGSRLERAGNWVGELLDLTPYSAPFQRLGASRSAGITDLRHGNVVDEDWQGLVRSGHRQDNRRPVPLPSGIRCYTAAATMGIRAGDAKDRLLGDGLVPLKSALGVHRDPQRNLTFPDEHRWVGFAMSHRELLGSLEVYGKLREWLEA